MPGHLKVALLKIAKKTNKFNFRSDKLLYDHFVKHGTDFNAINTNDYLSKANRFVNTFDNNILVKIRKKNIHPGKLKGDVIKYNIKTE